MFLLVSVHCSLDMDIIKPQVGNSDWHGLSGSVDLKDYHAPRWQPRYQSSAQPSIVTGAIDMNTDPGCDMTIGRNLVQTLPWFQVVVRPPRCVWPKQQFDPQIPTCLN